MAVDITLSKNDNERFGFRLSGGADYSFPLTVVRVAIGSLADQAGLRAGDVVFKINEEYITPLTNSQAQERIAAAGNNYQLSVYRNVPFKNTEKEYFVSYTLCK